MNKKILIVDDDADLVLSLKQILVSSGYEVFEAYSGADGLKKILEVKPGLIILDVMMESDTAGFEFASMLKNSRGHSKYSEFRKVPIILLTAISQVTNSRFSLNEEQSFLKDINEFCSKPVDPGDLLEKVKRHTG